MTNYNDGNWHGWDGGECPVHPKSQCDIIEPVDDTQNDDPNVSNGNASAYTWSSPCLFRVVKEYRESREWWIAGRHEVAFPSAREAKTAFPGCTPIHVREVKE